MHVKDCPKCHGAGCDITGIKPCPKCGGYGKLVYDEKKKNWRKPLKGK